MTFFEVDSVFGSWIGGQMTDKIDAFKIVKFSLFLTGILFFALQFVTSFIRFRFGIFL